MAEPLKNSYGAEVPKTIAAMIKKKLPSFDVKAFTQEALHGYESLDLMQRARKVSRALRSHLPENYPKAIKILIASLGPELQSADEFGMTPFLLMPHSFFVAEYGLDHFEESMAAQYEITKRFTAEFSIRPFLEHHQAATLKRLKTWSQDPNVHVRRLVSEGTRPRLPWAPRLRAFQKDPRPVLELLEVLKDDSELYVRRSVANNLNDIGKDHPHILVETAKRWLKDASKDREWIVRHSLRSAIKRAEPGALAVLGFGHEAKVSVTKKLVSPKKVRSGDSVKISFNLTNDSPRTQRVLVDFKVHFIKANGRGAPKVFKLKTVELGPHETIALQKKVSLKEMTTRKHYPGRHKVELLLNGATVALGIFDLAS